MTKSERLAYMENAKKIEEILPDCAYVTDVSVGYFVQLGGKLDFRKFAELHGSKVEAEYDRGNFYMYANLFGCKIVTVLYPEDLGYDDEARRACIEEE